jgi:hypothetical protein
MGWTTLVRIFSPEILSVDGFNTNFEMFKLKQKSIAVNMSGKSKFELESMIPDMDSINIVQKDSASVEFEMSPDYKSTALARSSKEIKSDEAMNINSVNANLEGYSILDVGHAQIQNIQLQIADSSAIILSGGALRKIVK